MGLAEKIKQFLEKGGKSAQVLGLMMSKPYVTCSEIINYQCENLPIVFTTSPHKLIERIRRTFGEEFIKSEQMTFEQTFFTRDGKPYHVKEHYKRYFLNYEVEVL